MTLCGQVVPGEPCPECCCPNPLVLLGDECKCPQGESARLACTENDTNQKEWNQADCTCSCPPGGAVCTTYPFTRPGPNCNCLSCEEANDCACPITDADCAITGRELIKNGTHCTCECPGFLTGENCDQCPNQPQSCAGRFGVGTQAVWDATACDCVCPAGGPVCDGTCAERPATNGTCMCVPGAEIGDADCVVCGDGIVSPSEDCDDASDPCCDPLCKNVTGECSVDSCKLPGLCLAVGADSKLECIQSEDQCTENECRTSAGTICEKNTDGSFKQCNYNLINDIGCGPQGLCSGVCAGGLCQMQSVVCDVTNDATVPSNLPMTTGSIPAPICWGWTCDPATGSCAVDWSQYQNATCNDNDLCTENDRCVPNPDSATAGTVELVCVGTTKCSTEEACRMSTCDNSTGRCDITIVPADPPVSCTAGSPCRQNKSCSPLGTCTGPKRLCPEDVCVAARCMETGPNAGNCENSTLYKDLQGCDDDDNCTDGDYCQNGTCNSGDDTCNNGSAALWPLGVAAGVVGLAALIAAVAMFFKMQSANLADPVTWGDFTGSQIENNPIYDAQVQTGDNPLFGQTSG
jgi:hypothetical protein